MLATDLTRITDLSREDVEQVILQAHAFKRKHDERVRRENRLDGKVVALVFEKPSLRTKVAFEVATTYLGGTPVFLSSSQILASGNNERGRESIPDIARNLERFVDLIVARVYHHEVIRELSDCVGIPVINALCDQHHPTQALADLLAIRQRFGQRPVRVAYVGDGNNVACSLMHVCCLVGYDFIMATPAGYDPPDEAKRVGDELAAKSGSSLKFNNSPVETATGADVIYTDTFVSMGQEKEYDVRTKAFDGFQVDSHLMKCAAHDAVFMHCLPAHRGEEVTDEVMDGPSSIVFDQAECRLHVAKALLATFLES